MAALSRFSRFFEYRFGGGVICNSGSCLDDLMMDMGLDDEDGGIVAEEAPFQALPAPTARPESDTTAGSQKKYSSEEEYCCRY